MESIGFSELDFAVIREGVESVVEKKVEERRDFWWSSYEELDRIKSARLQEKESENSVLRSSLLELEKKLQATESELVRLRDYYSVRESEFSNMLERGTALVERLAAATRRLIGWKAQARSKMKNMEDDISRYKRFAMDVGTVMERRRSSVCC